jgi:hypothetical protein
VVVSFISGGNRSTLRKTTNMSQVTNKHHHRMLYRDDLTFDKSMDDHLGRWRVNLKEVKAFLQDEGVTEVKDLLTNCIYLEDSMVNLYGINIYGSPW